MKMDRNQVIGFVLLGLLFFGYFYFNNRDQQALLKQRKATEDSLAKNRVADSLKNLPAIAKLDSQNQVKQNGAFLGNGNPVEQTAVLENELIKVTFSNKGAVVKSVELKKYKSFKGGNVMFGNNDFDQFSYKVNTSATTADESANLFFETAAVANNAGVQTLRFSKKDSTGRSITHEYVLRPNDYRMDLNLGFEGASTLFTGNNFNLTWNVRLDQKEEDVKYEQTQMYLCRMMENSYDFNRGYGGAKEVYEKPVQWVSFKQHFFNATLINKNSFTKADAEVSIPADTIRYVAECKSTLNVKLGSSTKETANLQFAYAPNDYHLLKSYDNGMHNIIDLGSGMWSFVKYLNRGVIKPVFDWLAKHIPAMGWVIALLTLFIRLITSPLVYGSYKSGAKMKVLRPELDAIKARLGGDQQAFGIEQMKLFREAGVNPLGGCIPTLLQIPIFFALFSLFNNEIALRGQSFLWAQNLAVYDSPIKFGFDIPLLGDHLSIFTITAALTSFFISMYQMSLTPTQDNPVMKYMPYIFPFMMLFWFNKMPSALTWYYTVNNLLVLGLQIIIQKFIINTDTIKAQMAEARTKPKTQSKWQQKFAEMQETQKKVQEMRNKTNSNKK